MMKGFFGVIASLMPKKPSDWGDLFLEAKLANTWELRFDALESNLSEGLETLWDFREILSRKRVILTLRSHGQGGSKVLSAFDHWKFWQELPSWLRALLTNPRTEVFVDWDLNLLQWVSKNGCAPAIPWSKIGGSYHDFEGGKHLDQLFVHAKNLRATKARAFLKFIITAKSHADVQRLEGIPLFFDEDIPLIFFAMGEKGKDSRRKCLSWGSAGTYGYLPKRASAAPGQLSIHELLSDPIIQQIVVPD